MLNEKRILESSTPIILPEWPAQTHIRAFFTTREGDPRAHSTVGEYLHDLPNDDQLKDPVWLHQTHSATVHRLTSKIQGLQGDGLVTKIHETPCAIKVADCVPVLLSDIGGTEVSAIHAGWRGLLSGIIENGVKAFECHPSKLVAWIGPSISKIAYSGGPEIKEMFHTKNPQYQKFFQKAGEQIHFDIREAVKNNLSELGVAKIAESPRCVYREKNSFYSFRREKTAKRMAAVIWISPQDS